MTKKNKNILTMLFDVIFETTGGNQQNIIVYSNDTKTAKIDASEFGKVITVKPYQGLNTTELNKLEKILNG